MRGEAFFFRLAQVVSAKPRKRLQPPERAGYLVVATCLVTKTDLGTRQCTPLRMSTTWVTRQSATIEVSA